MDSSTEYEVRCPSCDVSFPVGQKRCIHCGGTLGSRGMKELRLTSMEGLQTSGAQDDSPQGMEGFRPESRPSPAMDEDSDSETSAGRFGFLRGGMTLIWIVLAGLYSILRACGEG